jgi:pyruvate dehydrogenase E2 component (dihydrolipoamide acetyltransferase)
MPVTDIVLERQSANDETALVASVFVESGSFVKRNDILFEIENSKAIEEYLALADGIIIHQLQKGQTLDFGTVIATISDGDAGTALPGTNGNDHAQTEQVARTETPFFPAERIPVHQNGVVHGVLDGTSVATATTQSTAVPSRASLAAKKLMEQHQIPIAHFGVTLVTAADVMRLVEAKSAPATDSTFVVQAPPPKDKLQADAQPPTPQEGDRLSLRKLAEIDALSKGAGNSALSVLGIEVGPVMIARPAGDLLTDLITDVVIYEASRLMRQFPRLNAYFDSGRIVLHREVNGGLAMDRGGQLVVYGIKDTANLGLPELRSEMEHAVMRYMDDRLTSGEMQRATFTVSDLSSTEIDFMFPLLPKGQSLILGITRSSSGSFKIFAGFDHRVTEGLETSRFLSELRGRLQSFDESKHKVNTASSQCHYCGDTIKQTRARSKERGFLKIMISSTEEVLCCGSCWNGW